MSAVRAVLCDVVRGFECVVDMPTFNQMLSVCERRHRVTLRCQACGENFSVLNVHSRDGWVNTQAIGLCEDCDRMGNEETSDQHDIDNGAW